MKAKTSKKLKNGKKIKSKKISKTSNGTDNVLKSAQWKKVKLTGNLLSDDGGIGLEGLLGLEVLENPDTISVTKEKPVKVKKEKFTFKEDSLDDSDSDGKCSSKNDRKKKKKLLKKKNEKKLEKTNSTPGKFVLLRPPSSESNDEKNRSKAKKNKKSKKQPVEDTELNGNETALSINQLIVS